MRIAVLTIAFAAGRFMAPCIRQFEHLGLHHLVVAADAPHRGAEPGDDSAEIAAAAGATVVTGSWGSQPEQLNHGLDLLSDHDWVLIVDADEFYTRLNFAKLLGTLGKTRADVVTAPKMNVYWKTPEWRLAPDQTDNPAVAVRPSVRFTTMRQCDGEKQAAPVVMEHFSYVRTDQEMLTKLRSFEHSDDFDTQRWYETVWLPWTPASHNLHPLWPEKFSHVVLDPAPREITCLLP